MLRQQSMLLQSACPNFTNLIIDYIRSSSTEEISRHQSQVSDSVTDLPIKIKFSAGRKQLFSKEYPDLVTNLNKYADS